MPNKITNENEINIVKVKNFVSNKIDKVFKSKGLVELLDNEDVSLPTHRIQCYDREVLDKYKKNTLSLPHIDTIEPFASIKLNQLQCVIYMFESNNSEFGFNGTELYNRIYTSSLFNKTNFTHNKYLIPKPIISVEAKPNRCILYYSCIPHRGCIDINNTPNDYRFTYNTAIYHRTNNFSNDNMNFATL